LIRTPPSAAVKMQSGRLTAFQSVVGLGARDIKVGWIDAAGEGVAVEVGVIVGLVVGLGLVLDGAVEASGSSVQVGGKMTLVPVGTGLLLGGGANKSKEKQPDNVIRITTTKIQGVDPDWVRNRSGLRIQTFLCKPIIHPVSAFKNVLRYYKIL
jgi:hypothetical protein